MSRGILRTALTNKTLCLELEYREPSQPEGESSFATGMPRSHRSTSEEFAELRSAL